MSGPDTSPALQREVGAPRAADRVTAAASSRSYSPSFSRALAFGLLCGIIIGGGTAALARDKPAKPDTSRGDIQDIAVAARPISGFDRLNPSRTTFGKLEWIGGLVLRSSEKRFGGWSGLALDRDGSRLVAVSDAGSWMTADLKYRDGRPSAVANARIGPLKAKSGGRLRRDRDRDAEALVLTRGTLARGRLLIGFEQNHRLGVFSISAKGVKGPDRYLKFPAAARRMRALKGFEAVAQVQSGRWKGALVAIAERLFDRKRHHSGWILARGKAHRFSYTDIGGYDPTDAVGLENGDIIVLERRFRWTEGVKMRVRRIRARELRPGAVVKGDVLLEADMSQDIDNMEGIAAHRARDGSQVLTIMSDDNFNGFLQRTILLQFRLKNSEGERQARR